MIRPINTPIHEIVDSLLETKEVQLFVKREDLIHEHISGNKWRKLYYNIKQAKLDGSRLLATFGGAYSNHIAATAAVGKSYDFNTIGIIRGEECKELNPTLKFAKSCGMTLIYMNREDYRNKTHPNILNKYLKDYRNYYLIPEGGTNTLAVKGCEQILENVDKSFDIITCACGTGGTISGIINGLSAHQQAIGFTALKGADFLYEDIQKYVHQDNWRLNLNYHFGGYAKVNAALVSFMNNFYVEHKFRLDPVYTAKMMYGLWDLIEKDYFRRGTKILAIHTGGLQGIEGMNQKLNRKNLRIL